MPVIFHELRDLPGLDDFDCLSLYLTVILGGNSEDTSGDSNPFPPNLFGILQEDGFFILQEDGFRILQQ